MVSPIVRSHQLGVLSGKLVVQEPSVVGVPRDPISVLCEHEIYVAIPHEVSHLIQSRPFEARPRIPGVLHFGHDLVSLDLRECPQSFSLLGEGVAMLGLPGGRDPGIGYAAEQLLNHIFIPFSNSAFAPLAEHPCVEEAQRHEHRFDSN